VERQKYVRGRFAQDSGLRGIGWDGMDWIDLAQDRDQWGLL
jgi:hypothetical protein